MASARVLTCTASTRLTVARHPPAFHMTAGSAPSTLPPV
jgi:hypothetical protein